MDLISQITSSDLFSRLAKALLAAEYKDFQTIDDSGGDAGNDGYSESQEILFQFYCPEKPEKADDSTYKSKIKDDLDKAKALLDSGKYKIKDWIFVTPRELREPVQTYLRAEATAINMNGIAWASPKLAELFAKHNHLRSQFPDLIQPDIETQVSKISERLDGADDVKKEYRSKLEQSYQRRIDQAKQKLDQEKYQTAKSEYELILSDLNSETEKIDPHIYFRVYNNLGVAENNLQNNDRAAELFQKAYEAEPDLPMAICKGALAKVLKGVPAEGLPMVEKLLLGNPTDDQAIIAKANILHALDRYQELIAFLREKKKIALVHWFEGFKKMEEKNYDGAIVSFENVVKFEPKNVRALMLIAQNVMVGTREVVRDNPFPPDKIPKAISDKFTRATECLKEAAQLLRDMENKADLEMAYANLSGCYVALGLYENSISAADEAASIDPKSAIPSLNKGIAQLKLGRYQEAIKSFQTYKDLGGGDIEVDRHIAFCSLRTSDLTTAEKYITALLENESGLDLDMAELAVDLYSRKLDNEKLNPLLERLEKDFPNNSQALRLRSAYMQRLGLEGADVLLQRALQNAPSESERILTELDLADLRFDQKDYTVAAELYKKYINTQEGNPATWRYAQSIYNLGQYGALLDWIDTMSPEVRGKSLIEQLEAYANLYLGNLDKASYLFKDLFEKNPNSFQYVVYYAMCRFRLGKESEAKTAFDAVKNRVEDTADLITLAGGYEFIGEWEIAIDLTYKALEKDNNNPKAHLAYIFTFLKREQVNDEKLAEKYIKAFQKSIGEFCKRFPEEKALQSFEVKGNDVSEILKQVDRMAEITDNATNLYKESQAPLAFIPKLTGKSPFDVWAAFTQMPKVGIKISFGTAEEINTELAVIQEFQGNNIVVDIYPLFLLGHFDQLELLPKIFKKIYVHQSVVDELTSVIDDRKVSARKGVSSLAKIDGHHQMTQISPEHVQKSLDLLEKIRTFITSNANFEVRGFSKEKSEEERKIINALDESTKNSALLAQELGVPLYGDDRLLRAVINKENGIKSFSSQTFFAVAHKNGLIDNHKKFELQKKMIEFNYEYVSIDANFVFNQLKEVNYDIDKLTTIISYLVRKETSIQSLGIVLADLFFILMLDKSIDGVAKLKIFRFILNQAKENHNLLNIEEGMFANLQHRVRPEKQEELKKMLRLVFISSSLSAN
jgi:tetratricopeptide (TPR) repeat protein/predicted nucleic acid-binding protein